jgi:hypothetical protein
MQRRRILQLGVSSVVTSVALAGCSVEYNEPDEDGASTSTETNTPEESQKEDIGSVATNNIDGLEFVAWDHDTDGGLTIYTTVKNVGDQPTKYNDYWYDTEAYDADGNNLGISGVRTSYLRSDFELEPGETGRVRFSVFEMSGSPGAVASYELYLRCDEFENTVYC